jgi:hypothetical protein
MTSVKTDTISLDAIQQQYAEILDQLKILNERVAELDTRDKAVRAVLQREAELDREQEFLLKALGRRRTATRVAARIDNAPLVLEPFPYTIVDELLPVALYKCLITGIPPLELFSTKPVGKHLDVPFSLAPLYSHRIWRFMAETLITDVIAPRLIEKFRPQIDEWIRRNWPDLTIDNVQLHGTSGRIMFRQRGYRIAPHRDPKWSFITCILYLARPKDSEAWGTQLYAVEQDQEATSAAPYWIDEKRCTLVNDVAFRPNRLLAFLNSDGAHGAHIPSDAEPANLERYIYQFRIAPTAEAIATLKEKLPEHRRSLWAGKTLVDY